MKRSEMIAIIYRLNEISDLVGRLGDPYVEGMGSAAADLRWALAEGGLPLRTRIANLAQANRHIGALVVPKDRKERHPDHMFLLDAAEIVLSEIGAYAGEKRQDWRKAYPQ